MYSPRAIAVSERHAAPLVNDFMEPLGRQVNISRQCVDGLPHPLNLLQQKRTGMSGDSICGYIHFNSEVFCHLSPSPIISANNPSVSLSTAQISARISSSVRIGCGL